MNRSYSIALIALALLALLSLTLNVVVIQAITQVRETAHGIVSDARSLVADLADARFTYTIEVDQEFPVSMEFPFSKTMTVPVNTVVPIDTEVIVPVDLAFTTYDLRIPINTVFPVDMEFSVPISQVVDIETVVPMDVSVPVDIAIPETPLVDHLNDLETALERTAEQLERPLWEWRSLIDAG